MRSLFERSRAIAPPQAAEFAMKSLLSMAAPLDSNA